MRGGFEIVDPGQGREPWVRLVGTNGEPVRRVTE